MGIQNLWRELKPVLRSLTNLAEFAENTWVVDANIFMHMGAPKEGDGPPIDLFNSIITMLRGAGITPIFVFDGANAHHKRHEHQRRHTVTARSVELRVERRELLEEVEAATTDAEQLALLTERIPGRLRQHLQPKAIRVAGLTFTRTPSALGVRHLLQQRVEAEAGDQAPSARLPPGHYRAVRHLLESLGVGHITACDGNEAEQLCAHMTIHGEAQAVVTNDGDALVYGATMVVRNLMRDEPQLITLNDALRVLKLQSREQLVDVAIICGCDYSESKGLPNVGIVNALKLVRTHGSLANYLRSAAWRTREHQLRSSHKPEWAGFTVAQLCLDEARAGFLDPDVQPGRRCCTLDPAQPPTPITVDDEAAADVVERVGTTTTPLAKRAKAENASVVF
jgi:5'-3' exonuclease